MIDEEPKSFWDRTFDEGLTAKYSCFGCFGIAVILFFVGALMIDRRVGNNAGDVAPSVVADQQHNARPNAAATLPTKGDTTSGGDPTTAKIAGEMIIGALLKDGESAKFKNEFVSQIDGGNFMLCGLVNSKNSFGAYTGFKRFIASPNPQAPSFVEGEESGLGAGVDKHFDEAYRYACSNPVEHFG